MSLKSDLDNSDFDCMGFDHIDFDCMDKEPILIMEFNDNICDLFDQNCCIIQEETSIKDLTKIIQSSSSIIKKQEEDACYGSKIKELQLYKNIYTGESLDNRHLSNSGNDGRTKADFNRTRSSDCLGGITRNRESSQISAQCRT